MTLALHHLRRSRTKNQRGSVSLVDGLTYTKPTITISLYASKCRPKCTIYKGKCCTGVRSVRLWPVRKMAENGGKELNPKSLLLYQT